MKFTVVIPARYASTRLPGKPLLTINNKPMIQHVFDQASKSAADRVVIATDDQRIFDCAKSFGAEVVMTSAAHESGTDRLQEVVGHLGLASEEIIVNVQGDEPLIPPEVINQVAENLSRSTKAGMATLIERIDDIDTVFDPNAVKVVVDDQGYALYFSRAPIPWCRDGWQTDEKQLSDSIRYYRHIGIYAYRAAFLHDFVTWPLSSLEATEKLEQLRAMQNGVSIHAAETVATIPAGIDTPADLEKVRALFADEN